MKQAISRKNLWEALPTPIREVVGSGLSWIPLEWLMGRSFRRCMGLLREAQWWSLEQSQAYQLAALRRVIELAWQRSPYYQRLFRRVGFEPGDLKSLEDVRRLPLLERSEIREHYADMLTTSAIRRRIDYVSTSGTGGEPLGFYINSDRSYFEYAHLVSGWRRIGYDYHMPMGVFRGRTVGRGGVRFPYERDRLLGFHYFSTFHLNDEYMRWCLNKIATFGPCFLHVYPSSVTQLVRFIQRSGYQPPTNVRGIIAESEIVFPEERELAEQIFRCRYFSSYGQTEKVVAAAECEHSDNYHVWPTYGHFELVDEQGREVNTPGRRGEIVGTGFVNRVMPFIRYRTGDHAIYVSDHCSACGRQQVVIRDIQGHRIHEKLIASDGAEIPWTSLNVHDDTFEGVRQFQFYQDVPGRALLKLVVAPSWNAASERRILTSLNRKLAGRLQVTIQRVEQISLSNRGKAIYVDQRIGQGNSTSMTLAMADD